MDNNIELELSRILRSDTFSKSKRISDLLTHIVQHHLGGNQQKLTGTTIAQDVFNQDETFDPSKNPIVRVNTARLRRMLKVYYQTEGASNPVRLSLPKGGYKIQLEVNSSSDVLNAKAQVFNFSSLNRVKVFWGCSALFLLFIVAVFKVSSDFQPGIQESAADIDGPVSIENLSLINGYPSVAVLPFENATLDPKCDNLEKGFQRQITADLYPFRVLRVVKVSEESDLLNADGRGAYDYVISGKIKKIDSDIKLIIELRDLKTGGLVLRENITRNAEGKNYYDVLAEISAEVSNNFAGVEGPFIKQKLVSIKQNLENTTHTIKRLSAFECFSLFADLYMTENIASESRFSDFVQVYGCLQTELKHNPDDATLLSAFATLSFDLGSILERPDAVSAETLELFKSLNPNMTRQQSLEMAMMAVKLDIGNDFSYAALTNIQIYMKDYDGAYTSAKKTMTLNRGNPDHLARYAIVAMNLDKWDEAVALSKEAIARNIDAAGYYYLPLFYQSVLEKNIGDIKKYLPQVTRNQTRQQSMMIKFLAASLVDDDVMLDELREDVQTYIDRNKNDQFNSLSLSLSQNAEAVFEIIDVEFQKSGIVFSDENTLSQPSSILDK